MKKNENTITLGQRIGTALLVTSLTLSQASAFAEEKQVKIPIIKSYTEMMPKVTNYRMKRANDKMNRDMAVELAWVDYNKTHKRIGSLFKEVIFGEGWIPISEAMDEGVVTVTKKGSDKLLSKREVWSAFYDKEELDVHYDKDKWNWKSANIYGDNSGFSWPGYPQILVLKKDKIKAAETAAELGLELDIKPAIEAGIITVTAEGSNKPLSYEGFLLYCNHNSKYSYEGALRSITFNWDHEKYPDWKGVSIGYLGINDSIDSYLIIDMDPEIKKQKLEKRFNEVMGIEQKKDKSIIAREWREQTKTYQKRLNVRQQSLRNKLIRETR